MTLTLIIITNVVLDVALLGLLAFVMSRPAKLEPHRPGITGNAWRLRRPLRHRAHEHSREERPARRLASAID
jgi:hypothetical protein